MLAGLASPSYLIIVPVLVLFGAKRIPELAKGLGTGIKELRAGIPTGVSPPTSPACTRVRGEDARAGSGDETAGPHAGRGSL